MPLNPKVFVGAAVAALAVILGGILLAGPSVIIDDPRGTAGDAPQARSVQVELDDIKVARINDRSATIDISFEVSNPNPRSMIVQVMDYQLFETDFSETRPVSGGQIGTRPEGMVEFGSNYYTLLGENSILLKDTITLRNSGNTPELWSALESGTASWKVSGDIFYNLSSMTSGQENELHFEFTR